MAGRLALLAFAWVVLGATARAAEPAWLLLDGVSVGFAERVDTGGVAVAPRAAVAIEGGSGLGAAVFDWIDRTLEGELVRRSLGFRSVGSGGGSVQGVDLLDATITKVTFPRLDPATRSPARLVLEVRSEGVEYPKPQPAAATPRVPRDTWQSARFRVEIEGLPCERVLALDGLAWSQVAIEEGQGPHRYLSSGGVEIHPFELVLPATDLPAWDAWMEAMVEGGDAARARSGSNPLLGADARSELARIELTGLRPIRMTARSHASGGEAIRTLAVDIGVGGIRLAVPAAARR